MNREAILRQARRRLINVALVYLVVFGPIVVVGVIVAIGRVAGVIEQPHTALPPKDRPIVGHLKSGNFQLQENALKELKQPPPDWRQRDVAEGLKAVLRTGTVELKFPALKALAAWGQPDDAPAIIPFLQERWPGIAAEALHTLSQLKGPLAAEALADLLGTEHRAAALSALRTFGREAEKPVQLRLKHANPRVRQDVCELLGQVGSAECVPALQQAAKDADPSVRTAAAQALAALAKKP